MNGLFANLFEFWGFLRLSIFDTDDTPFDFSDDLAYNVPSQPYVWMGILFIVITLLMVTLLYTRFDNPKYSNIKTYILFLLIALVISFIGATAISYAQLQGYCIETHGLYPYPIHFNLTLGGVAALYSAILFFISSLIIRKFSVNQKNNPL